jgi:hypothetical protein
MTSNATLARRQRAFTIAGVLAYAAIICRDGSLEMILALALVIVCLAVVWVRMWSGPVFWLEAGVVMGVLFVLQFANGAVYAHYFPERVAVRDGLDDRLVRDIQILLAGAGAWLLGYVMPIGSAIGNRLPRLKRELSYRKMCATLAAALAACWTLRTVTALGLVSPTFSTYSRQLPQMLLPIGIGLWAASGRSLGTNPGFVAIWLSLYAAEVLYNVSSTMKGSLFYPLLLAAAGLYLVRRRVSPLAVGVIAVLVVLWIPVGLYFRLYRQANDSISTSQALAYAVDETLSREPRVLASQVFAYLLHRAQMLDVFDAVVTNVPDVEPYHLGRTYADVPLMLVPRVLWPNKPVFSYMKGEWGRDIAGVTPETEAVGMGVVAEFHYNFGLAGIVGGMLLLGAMGRAAWVWFSIRNDWAPHAAMLYLILIKQFMSAGAAASVTVGTIQFALLYLVFYRFSSVRRVPRRSVGASQAGRAMAAASP